MSTTFQRRPLTAAIQTALQAIQVNSHDVLVGLGVIPLGAGWGSEQPNQPGASFVPYLVLTTMTASPAADSGSVGSPQDDWHLPYLVQSFGVRHDQVEWMADSARNALSGMRTQILTLGPSNYIVQQVWTSSIGGVNRVPDTDPAYSGQQDQVTIWVAKRKS